MRAKRIDSNHTQIVQELRSLGYSVEDTHDLGKGFPDILLGFGGFFSIPVEIKSGKAKLNKIEQQWHEQYKGYAIVAYSTEDVVNGVKDYMKELYKCLQEMQMMNQQK